ncbi:MAG: tRNA uridine(34) 5-carboxymethylaminomethyl modification radical SAM/GNAT enzyme Elp3 [Planctomycetota bacterium]
MSRNRTAPFFHVGLLERHEERLVTLIEALRATDPLDPATYDRLTRAHGRGDGPFRKSDIIYAFRQLASRRGWTEAEDTFIARIRMKPVRTSSGVAPVTVLTRPHPCPGRCVFCPSDVKMPKSYLSMEPGAQRAARYRFDPYLQTWNRMRALFHNGHRLDKIELIILGGSFNAYKEPYQIWFVRRCLEAMNEFQTGTDPPHLAPAKELLLPEQDRLHRSSYNEVLGEHLRSHPPEGELSTWAELEAVQKVNETAAARCVGLSVETRPDLMLVPAEAERIRRLGATKVQLGYQSLDDEILKLSERGHDVAASRQATRVLREAGFKCQAHWMPNLPGATPQRDMADFTRLFTDPDFRPDELKIYPCTLIESSPLMALAADGRWEAYPEEELLEVLAATVGGVAPYCRLTRVVRDIPSHDILAGNRVSNLRERVEGMLRERGRKPRDIRARQIRRPLHDLADVVLEPMEYQVSTGQEVFLQGVTPADELVGFLRLSLPARPSRVAELGGSAVIREVHVYGAVAGLETAERGASQHLGLGSRLIQAAREICGSRGFGSLAVISGIGTREYYRRQGFVDGVLYQHADLS